MELQLGIAALGKALDRLSEQFHKTRALREQLEPCFAWLTELRPVIEALHAVGTDGSCYSTGWYRRHRARAEKLCADLVHCDLQANWVDDLGGCTTCYFNDNLCMVKVREV